VHLHGPLSSLAASAAVVKMISGVARRYELGGGHDLVGRVMPLLELADSTTLADHFHNGGAVLLDLSGSDELRELAGDRAKVVSSKVELSTLTGLLVRPDGYVAWASEDGSVAGLAESLTKTGA
jgi:hypothetical protein